MSPLIAGFRIALRQLQREWLRSALITLFVALPIAAATWAGAFIETANRFAELGSRRVGEAELVVRASIDGSGLDPIRDALQELPNTRLVLSSSAIFDPWTEAFVGSAEAIEPEIEAIDGGWPTSQDDLMITEDIAEHLGLSVGDVVAAGDMKGARVTAIYRYGGNRAWISARHPFWSRAREIQISVFGAAEVLEAVVDRNTGLSLLPVVPYAQYSGPRQDSGETNRLLAPAAGALLLLVTGTMSAAVMVIGLRRRSRQIGLLAVVGASPRQLQVTVVAQATLLTAGGVLVGCVIGVMAAQGVTAGYGALRIDAVPLVTSAVMGILVGPWFAAPAASLAAKTPLAAAREGRIPSGGQQMRGRKAAGISLTAAAVLGLIEGSSRQVDRHVLIAGALTCVVGVLLATPLIGRLVIAAAPGLPMVWRVAVRDVLRNSARSAGSIGVLAIALAVPMVLTTQGTTPTERLPGPVIGRLAFEDPVIEEAAIAALLEAFPEAARLDLRRVLGPSHPSGTWSLELASPSTSDRPIRGASIFVVAPDQLSQLGLEGAAHAIAKGSVVVLSEDERASARWIGPRTVDVPLMPVGEVEGPLADGMVLLSDQTANRLGLQVSGAAPNGPEFWLLRRAPTWQDAPTLSMLGMYEGLDDLWHPLRSERVRPWSGVAAALVLALGVSAVIGALTKLDLDEDIERIVALGSSPTMRRHALAATHGAVSVSGSVLAMAFGVVFVFWTDLNAPLADQRGVPWAEFATIGVSLPIISTAATWFAVRSKPIRPPRRIE